MKLRDDEKRMLNGDQGAAIQKAMEYLVDIGDAYVAEEMVDIKSAHILGMEMEEDGTLALLAEQAKGVKVRVPTTNNAMPVNPEWAEPMGLSDEFVEMAKAARGRIAPVLKNLGITSIQTCSPFFFHRPRVGDQVSMCDCDIAPTANGWYGARTNLESPSSALASAITGKAPNCGLRLTDNRVGEVLIEVDPELEAQNFDYGDCAALAFWAGKILQDSIPVIPVYNGLSPKLSRGRVKQMSAAHVKNSGIGMFHVVGVTPEAPTVEAAFGGRKPKMKLTFGRKELNDTIEELTTATGEKVDLISLGCPHFGVEELAEVAQLLNGRKVHKDTRLLLSTNWYSKAVAKEMGIVDAIEEAGGLVLTSSCPSLGLFWSIPNPITVATVTAYMAALGPQGTRGRVTCHFGRLSDCINAAVTGKWEAS